MKDFIINERFCVLFVTYQLRQKCCIQLEPQREGQCHSSQFLQSACMFEYDDQQNTHSIYNNLTWKLGIMMNTSNPRKEGGKKTGEF